ncbi:MAG TPA: DUF1707 domain-containing protein [Streptosporangiaceae bacterium]|nr:DUF1707 domain-containing protein [Streptosporangiaceae bacterium]
MASEHNVRVSDADRDATAAQLRENYAQGRLTLDELNQRLELAFAARTRADLDAVTRDLPYVPPSGALPSDRARPGDYAEHGSSGSQWAGQSWSRQNWGTGPGWTGPGAGRSRCGALGFIPLLVSLAIVLLVFSALGFGFGSGPSLWVIIVGALAALRWLFGWRRRGPRAPFPLRRGGRRRW